ncbi:MAG: NRDE family protein [Myxococcota bacterium]
MCTLIVLHRCVPGRPLVVAANRDEFLARPAEGPAVRPARTGRILAPRDLEAGGTWVGLSERGVFAGLTNLRPIAGARVGVLGEAGAGEPSKAAPKLRSRGEVVMAALEASSAAAATESLARLDVGVHNPFQLLVADAQSAALVVYRESPRIFPLEPGIHVVGNVEDERVAGALGAGLEPACIASADGKPFPGFEGIEGLIDTEEPRAQKLVRIRGQVEKLLTEPGRDLFEGLARICREHVEEGDSCETGARPARKSPFESTCVHVADRYGTRSSLLLELAEELPTSRFWTTDGPPCRRPFENRSFLLSELGVRPAA